MTLCDGLTDEMEMNVDVFGASVEFRIFQKFDCALIVAVKGGWKGNRVEKREFLQELVEPYYVL